MASLSLVPVVDLPRFTPDSLSTSFPFPPPLRSSWLTRSVVPRSPLALQHMDLSRLLHFPRRTPTPSTPTVSLIPLSLSLSSDRGPASSCGRAALRLRSTGRGGAGLVRAQSSRRCGPGPPACARLRPGVVERGGRGGAGRQADGRSRAGRGCWARAVVLRTRARASAPLASLGRVCATRRASVTATRAHRAHRGPAPRARLGGGGGGGERRRQEMGQRGMGRGRVRRRVSG